VILTGTISAVNVPASIAATARWCERSAHASCSSRVMPTALAVFQPTEIDMSRFGASAESGWVGGYQSANSSAVPWTRRLSLGAVEVDCTPPATTTRSMPDLMPADALPMVVRLPAQCRLTACPATVSKPQTTAA
jgi:hypothetical protein